MKALKKMVVLEKVRRYLMDFLDEEISYKIFLGLFSQAMNWIVGLIPFKY